MGVSEAGVGNGIIYYGGSFNPPHIAHHLFVCALRAYFPEARVWVSPAYRHAFGKRLMPYDLRESMLEAMFAGIGGVSVETFERDLGLTYTVDVVREIRRMEPGAGVYLAVGADIVGDLPKWREYDVLVDMARFLVFPRAGYDGVPGVLDVPLMPEVSSSEVRSRMSRGLDIGGLVPSAVLEVLAGWRADDPVGYLNFVNDEGAELG